MQVHQISVLTDFCQSDCLHMIRSQVPGSNNINHGVLLALNRLNNIKYSETDHSIEVGPGNKWVDVYSALAPFGRYAIGGRLKTIGVPGLTLIGGVGYFLNKYGFSMDNVLSYDVVLGNGTMVTANSRTNPDLFWALKGGANNFGVVTKFVLQTYSVPVVSSTYQVFEEAMVGRFIAAACDMALSDDASVGAGAVININYNVSTKTLTPQVFGLQEGESIPPSHFASFNDIPALRRMHNVTEPVTWHSQFETPNQMFRSVDAVAELSLEAQVRWLMMILALPSSIIRSSPTQASSTKSIKFGGRHLRMWLMSKGFSLPLSSTLFLARPPRSPRPMALVTHSALMMISHTYVG